MPAAHSPAPVSEAEAARLFADLVESPGLVLAISGGPDSTALLVLAARWRDALKGQGPPLLAVTIDHGLRPESAGEATAVARLSSGLGVPHSVLFWTGPKPVTGLQQAARAARYRLLVAAGHEAGAGHILTAHTRDDQAETVLMRLARGSGLTGLAAMARALALPEGDGLMLVRPFLPIAKARLIATLAAAGIASADDPSNRDPRFTRARLRGLMPALSAEGLDAGRLGLLAQRMARADAALEAAVDDALVRLAPQVSSWRFDFDARAVASVPQEVALRMLGRAIGQVGGEGRLELAKLEALFAALSGGEASQPPRFRRTLAGASVTLQDGRVVVEPAPPRRRTAKAAKPDTSNAPAEAPIVKEIEPIPLADVPRGPTLALGRSRSLQIARATVAARLPARHKGRQ